jgi:hypothetical protein
VTGDPEPALCPSSSCSPGHLLLGILRPDGTVAGVRPPLPVDAAFVRRASAEGLRAPETRFRFAGPCVTSACQHWTGSRCRVGDAAAAAGRADAVLPPCPIRRACRWWLDSGPAACQTCSSIVRTPVRAVPPEPAAGVPRPRQPTAPRPGGDTMTTTTGVHAVLGLTGPTTRSGQHTLESDTPTTPASDAGASDAGTG